MLSSVALRGSQLALLLIATLMISKMISSPFFWLTGYIVFQCALTLLLGVFPLVNPNVVGKAMNLLIYHLAGTVFLYSVIQSKIPVQRFFNVICVGAIIQAIIAISQYFDTDIMEYILGWYVPLSKTIERDDLAGTLGNSNFCSAYLAISVPFFFRKYWKWGILLVVPVILASKSSTAVIALAVGMAVYSQMWWVFIGAGVAGCLYAYVWDFNPSAMALERRFSEDFPFVISQILDKPWSIITGQGPGVKWQGDYPVHCEPLSFMLRHGAIGTSFAVGFVFDLLLQRPHRTLKASLIISLVCMLGTYSMTVAPIAVLTLTITGLIMRETCVN